jgi:hypothetical protein
MPRERSQEEEAMADRPACANCKQLKVSVS